MARKHTILVTWFLIAGLCSLPAIADSGFTIEKCQDANGEWHYGDTADVDCAKSKIIEINNSGVETKEIAGPLTAAQLKERAAQQAAAKKQEKQAEKDQLLRSMYASESDITYVRDRKIADVESQIRASEETVKSLNATLVRLQKQERQQQTSNKAYAGTTATIIANTQSQIATHEASIKEKRQEEDTIRKQAAADLARYRELEKKPPQPAAAGAGTTTPSATTTP